MKLPRANFAVESQGGDAPALAGAETDIARAPCVLMTHEMVVSADADMAIVRVNVPGQVGPKMYVGMQPCHALKMAEAFRRAALHADPKLRGDVKIIGGEAS